MVYYLIVCRSLTYAQRTASALERAALRPHPPLAKDDFRGGV